MGEARGANKKLAHTVVTSTAFVKHLCTEKPGNRRQNNLSSDSAAEHPVHLRGYLEIALTCGLAAQHFRKDGLKAFVSDGLVASPWHTIGNCIHRLTGAT